MPVGLRGSGDVWTDVSALGQGGVELSPCGTGLAVDSVLDVTARDAVEAPPVEGDVDYWADSPTTWADSPDAWANGD